MKIFNNLKLAQKLIFCFLLISFLIGIIGFRGISEIKKINANSTSMYEDNLKHLKTVSSTAQQSAESSEGILNSVDETTAATQEVANSAQRQAELSEELNFLVQKFKI